MTLVKTNWLNAATSLQVTEPEEVPGATKLGLQVSASGNPSSALVWLQGSIDGVNWHNLLGLDAAGSPKLGFVGTSTGVVVRYVRLELSALTGGTSPAVSASLVATEGV
ncbi:hypothetical protein FLW53_09565 [Microbispora sp. SCL1-1]|uniref:hypothetical protein n=1 Tax=unclassified Microbispora TaxID=2614687 RepID=UPI001157E11F|nr:MULTISPECIES: hypothetical protein [unclassified Microbispora]NJP24451.1 hypothetical protein [Microbispora sp. CL1-1]TQS14597.1 hypothetical protein FLW53_09565 [Microbispora sp. SCL1-1]